MPDNNDSFATFEGSLDFNNSNLDQEIENLDWERLENNCDRITESYAWGLVEREEVDCSNDGDYSDEDGTD